MSMSNQHESAVKEIKEIVDNMSVEDRSKFEETINVINSQIVKHGSLAVLAIAYVGSILALEEDKDEGE